MGVVGNGVVAGGRGCAAVPDRVVGRTRGDCRGHGAVRSHPGDGHVVVLAAAADNRGGRAGGATQSHVTRREVGDGLAEVHAEVDRRGVRRIVLTGRLVDRHRRLAPLPHDGVVRRRRSVVAVTGLVRGSDRRNRGDHGAVGGHP